ncbi:MAG: PLP-dependent lyase/thiolase [Nanoarchaeota archaeon]|nr:PLP-dependent lyase/thiolase [Nanoarchaeota archaeon]MBU1632174.1 PLP-dependent lyase/thiolase [Nanoarchaeota archaeon]MBU1875495.1 PLP-dependent lyase/thiolase [Nanoarchaeota archaeon]
MSLTERERRILYSIRVASENNPTKPEFPPDSPKFPATSTYKIKVPGFSNVWIKDESYNPTGTHKDRLAWEMVVNYRDILLAKKDGRVKEKLPQLSIITSGAAGVAIQTVLNKYHLPPLKCLVDLNLKKDIVECLETLGCELYFTDLSRKPLSWKEILELTENPNGIDVTSSEGLDPEIIFYDWLGYEIINHSPDYCFIPFGSGHLYENVLNINKQEVSTAHHDPRFKGDVKVLKNCNFIGATVNDPRSKADKLFAHHRPFALFDEQWLRCYTLRGFCGPESNVYLIREKFLDEAMKLAREQKIVCEHSGIAGLAMLLQMKDKVPKNKKILIVNTGKAKINLS